MSKQQDDLFTQQDVQSDLFKDVEEAKKILTSVQNYIRNSSFTSRIQQKLNAKTSIDAEEILTKQLSALKKSYAKDEEKYNL